MRITIPLRKLALLAAASLPLGPAHAQHVLPQTMAPLPYARPSEATASPFDRLDGKAGQTSATAMPRGLAALKDALDSIAAGSIAEAREVRDALPEGALDRDILTWALASSGSPAVGSTEIEEAARMLSGWPGLDALGPLRERALIRETPAPGAAVAAFSGAKPQTAEGALLLARAHLKLGDNRAALQVLLPVWWTERLGARDEVAVIRQFGSLLKEEDHLIRMERMLYLERIASAERVATLAGAEKLHAAWAAVIRQQRNAGALLEAVPSAERSAGYAYARARYLRRQEKLDDAASVVIAAPRDGGIGVDADQWWLERRALSRALLEEGKVATAHAVAAHHAAESPALAAEAEFHAGWFALLSGKPTAAATHFARIADIASGPISLARAHYWMGRAAEAGGGADAKAHYARAAAFETVFYGQVAAAKLGREVEAPRMPEPSAEQRLRFAARQPVRAIRRLESAGAAGLAARLYRALAEELQSPAELALLVAMAEERGDHYLALRIGKTGAARGLDIGALAHPLGAIPEDAHFDPAGKALAYAVARQESEFNAGAVSPAGARGLLQLLPGTAREMARKAGIPFSAAGLTGDPAYNATLGAAFLGQQLDRFDGSYVLTFAGYNAGPGRALAWMKRNGDPRGKDIDAVVDWIERIPFSETRNYVQRVMENYQVYKLRLKGSTDMAADLTKGRG